VRLLLCGKNDSAVEALEFLRERGDEVLVIGIAGDSGKDGWQRSLVAAARADGVPCEQPARINAPETIAALRAWRPDLLVSIQYDQILKEPFFRGIGCPCLNLHFALLPRNRGVAPIAWAILEGDREAGATLHHMRVDIDAGDVVAQRAVPIASTDTGRALYDKVSHAASALFRDSYPFGPALLGRRIPQDAALATYHRNGEFDFARRDVDWTMEAARLQRWLRALVFPPFQFPLFTLGGRTFAITAVGGEVGASDAAPGSVIAAGPSALDIAAAGGSVRILACGAPDGRPVKLAEIAGLAPVGARLEHAR
jgi:methionyl-tRNA formyltransferase